MYRGSPCFARNPKYLKSMCLSVSNGQAPTLPALTSQTQQSSGPLTFQPTSNRSPRTVLSSNSTSRLSILASPAFALRTLRCTTARRHVAQPNGPKKETNRYREAIYRSGAPYLQQGVFAFDQLSSTEIGPRQVKQDFGIRMLVKLLQTVLVLKITDR